MLLQLLWLLLTVAVLTTVATDNADKPTFSVIWHARNTYRCDKRFNVTVNVTQYGMKANQGDGWIGDVITIGDFGSYPYIADNGTFIKGGLPQAADFEDNIVGAMQQIDRVIPDESFSGLGVVDWERWFPVFEMNNFVPQWKVYINESIKRVRRKHPDWSQGRVFNQSRKEYDRAARRLMSDVLAVGQAMRPNSRWGFYTVPECYQYKESFCSSLAQTLDDRLKPILAAGKLILPSTYINRTPAGGDIVHQIHGVLAEANRLRASLRHKVPDMQVYSYSTIVYPYLADNLTFYTEPDLVASLTLPLMMGAEGVILWEADYVCRTAAACKATAHYIDTLLGPLVQQLISVSRRCQKYFCPPVTASPLTGDTNGDACVTRGSLCSYRLATGAGNNVDEVPAECVTLVKSVLRVASCF